MWRRKAENASGSLLRSTDKAEAHNPGLQHNQCDDDAIKVQSNSKGWKAKRGLGSMFMEVDADVICEDHVIVALLGMHLSQNLADPLQQRTHSKRI